MRVYCLDCQLVCEKCEVVLCEDCGRVCDFCGKLICFGCFGTDNPHHFANKCPDCVAWGAKKQKTEEEPKAE